MDFPDKCIPGAFSQKGEIVNNRPVKTSLAEDAKKPDERLREALRKRLIEMIRRNELGRREKPR